MNPWIYFFSKFSDELILLEAFVLFILSAIYAAYWVMRRSKLNQEHLIPASRVQEFLDQIIDDATEIEEELFGKGKDRSALKKRISDSLQASAARAAEPAITALAPETVDAQAGERIRELEQLILEKERALSEALNEKQSVEKKLAEASSQPKADSTAPAAAAAAPATNNDELHKKIKNLEDRLAEYSVIEDDLANLKRLQQENQKLKTAMTQAGVPLPTGTSASTPTAAASSSGTSAAATASTSGSSSPASSSPAGNAAPASAQTPAATGSAPAAAAQSTQTAAAATQANTAANTAANATPSAATTAAAAQSAQTAAAAKKDSPTAASAASTGATASAGATASTTGTSTTGTAATSAPAAAASPAAGATASTAAQAQQAPFDKLESNVDQSLAAKDAANKPPGKSDDDLLAEFEKMLNL